MSWEQLFDRATAYETTTEEIQRALASRRDEQDDE